MSHHPNRGPVATLRLTLLDVTVTCTRCGTPMPPGTPLLAITGDDWTEWQHDPSCPPRWRPRLIQGSGRTTPSRTVLLATVSDDGA